MNTDDDTLNTCAIESTDPPGSHMADGIFLSHPKYVTNLLAHFHMSDCKPAPAPFQSGVKLIVECTTPLDDATLCR